MPGLIPSTPQGDFSTYGLFAKATAAEVKAGNNQAKAVTGQVLLAALGFSAYFESAAQAITAAGALTIAHGLTRKPVLLFPVLVCLTAEYGYSIGDEVVAHPEVSIGTVGGYGMGVVVDATNINIRYGAQGTTFVIVNKTSGATQQITNANWNMKIRAWG